MKYLIVFLFIFISDSVWTFYIASVAKNKPLTASIFSSLTVLLGMAATVMVVNDIWCILPAMAGAFLGTLLTVKLAGGEKWKTKPK